MARDWWQLLVLARPLPLPQHGQQGTSPLSEEGSWLLFKPLRLLMAIQTLKWSLTPTDQQVSLRGCVGVGAFIFQCELCLFSPGAKYCL